MVDSESIDAGSNPVETIMEMLSLIFTNPIILEEHCPDVDSLNTAEIENLPCWTCHYFEYRTSIRGYCRLIQNKDSIYE
jgi:hypothetical protein